ncbi:bacterial regulatory helix-turn-helix, lysR family protein [Bordetella holmesii ATCC 51541]|nr:bacterial regulatory helix-turn-helix, lysR family protein [Bordetella holmesii ATCC 51541]
MLTLRHIEVFHAVMRTGSVTGAARLLNVSQPAVSAVLKHCEARARIRLFERTGRRLVPTAEAVALFPDVAAIYGRLDSLTRQMQDLAGGRIGALSVAGPFRSPMVIWPRPWPAFWWNDPACGSHCSR